MAWASYSAASPKAKAAGSERDTFDLYDSLLFIRKPDLSRHGLKRARTVYENELWPPKRSAIPDEAAVRSKARAVLAEGVTAAVPVILDVEQYSVDVRSDISHINPDTSIVDANILKLEQIIGWFKNEAPTLQVGFFDVAAPVDGLPVTGQQPANDAELATWKRANSYLIPFATHVDALCPCLYTVETDPAKWVASAQRSISESKRIGSGKPVRPFIWPAPDFERFARIPCPIASLASWGISSLSSALDRSCSRKACRVLRNIPADSAQEFEALMSTIRTASMRGFGGSTPNRRGGSPLSTQRQNLRSAVMVERIGMSRDLDPFAAASDYRKHSGPGRHNPHVVLELRHVFFRSRLFRERPGQHELGLKESPGCFDPSIQSGHHPPQRRMPDLPLDIGEGLASIGLIPTPIQVLRGQAELDDEVAREVLRLDLAPLHPPQSEEGRLIVAHDNPGVRATDEIATIHRLVVFPAG
jgi:hypothetical protein